MTVLGTGVSVGVITRRVETGPLTGPFFRADDGMEVLVDGRSTQGATGQTLVPNRAGILAKARISQGISRADTLDTSRTIGRTITVSGRGVVSPVGATVDDFGPKKVGVLTTTSRTIEKASEGHAARRR